MPKTWPDIVSEISGRIKKAQNDGESLWFRGQNEPWPIRSKLHRYVLEIEKRADQEGQTPPETLAGLLRKEFQTMYLRYGQLSTHILPTIEQGPWGRVFSMQHYGVSTPLIDFTESFAVALYMANWNRDPKRDAAVYLLEPLKMNSQSHIGPHHTAIGDDFSGYITRALLELYHPTLYSTIPDDMEKPDVLHPLAVTPTAINGRMRAQKAVFVLAGQSFESIDDNCPGAISRFILPSATYDDSMDWLNLVGYEHSEFFPDVWGISEDFKSRDQHIRKLAEQIATEART